MHLLNDTQRFPKGSLMLKITSNYRTISSSDRCSRKCRGIMSLLHLLLWRSTAVMGIGCASTNMHCWPETVLYSGMASNVELCQAVIAIFGKLETQGHRFGCCNLRPKQPLSYARPSGQSSTVFDLFLGIGLVCLTLYR